MSQTILILGSDGYCGWPLVCRLLDDGHTVIAIDNLTGRNYRGASVTPIATPTERWRTANEVLNGDLQFVQADTSDYGTLRHVIAEHDPDTIVNLAQIPSAPYSMRGDQNAWRVQQNNVRGALTLHWVLHDLGRDDTPVVQLATMGEYGTPDTPIPEGFLDDGRPAPKQPGSFYHVSKAQMTLNAQFVARAWGHPITEVYQGIVYGVTTDATDRDERLRTRFDVDEAFGTVLNRFTAQAVAGHPLTVYGDGGQKRATLSLQDCVNCLSLAIEHPPAPGGPGRYPYRAINQFDGSWRVHELAQMVASQWSKSADRPAPIEHVDNPRAEDDSDHFYEPERHVLDALGYERARPIAQEVRRTLAVIEEHADRIPDDLRPSTVWN